MEALGVLIFMAVVVFCVLLGYKKRYAIGRWLNDPTFQSSQDPSARRKRLERTIEDAQDELARLDAEEGDNT